MMFCGLGAGKGWHTFKFILTPKEFENLFNDCDYHFVITNSRVEIGYKMTDKNFFFHSYKTYFEEIISGKSEIHWQFINNIRISITDSLNKISFKEIADEKFKNEFKLVDPIEPVVNISPFYLYFSDNQQLSIAYMNDEGIIGLELTFPKYVSFESENYSVYHETKDFRTFGLYETLLQRVKKIAQKAKIKSENKLFKPNFWISPDAIKIINRSHYLKTKKLTIL